MKKIHCTCIYAGQGLASLLPTTTLSGLTCYYVMCVTLEEFKYQGPLIRLTLISSPSLCICNINSYSQQLRCKSIGTRATLIREISLSLGIVSLVVLLVLGVIGAESRQNLFVGLKEYMTGLQLYLWTEIRYWIFLRENEQNDCSSS